MKRCFAIICLLLLAGFSPAMRTVIFSKAPAVSSYTGPGDIVTFKTWYGLRAYSAAKRGSKIANVCNSTGGVDVGCADMFSDPITGKLSAATINGITCPGPNCTIKTFYDQSGSLSCTTGTASCDLAQNSVGLRPTLVANCVGALPCANFLKSASQVVSKTGNLYTITQPFSVSGAFERTATFTSQNSVMAVTGAGWSVGLDASANKAYHYAGATQTATGATDSAFHAIQYIYNGASSAIVVDGSSTTTNPGAQGSASTQSMIIGDDGFGNSLTGNVLEIGEAAGTLTGTQQTSLNSNQHTFWGF